ncbi:hypothetical protein D3C78_1961170 [compost metagenome]
MNEVPPQFINCRDDQQVTLCGFGIDLFAVNKCLDIAFGSRCGFVECSKGVG